MNNQKFSFTILFLCLTLLGFAQEDEDYVEFNDRNNVVHGVYLGLNWRYGEIEKKNTYTAGFKVAYVANQQFEIGFEGNFLYSNQNLPGEFTIGDRDLIGAYGGCHVEFILFSKKRVNLSFPLLIGVGAVGYVSEPFSDTTFEDDLTEERIEIMFVAEPGVSLLFNVSRYVQLEAGVKYRISDKIAEVSGSSLDRINGFSGGLGIKVGVFNMGRNRYKKNL